MILVMGANLYISRIILVALGVNDYGIYSVVGGMVTLFSLISGSLSAAIARFLTFELGTKDKEKLKIIFSTSFLLPSLRTRKLPASEPPACALHPCKRADASAGLHPECCAGACP